MVTSGSETARLLSHGLPTSVRWLLSGTDLPPVENSLLVGERFKESVQGVFGNSLPAPLRDKNTHGQPTRDDHTHPFYLPEDDDGDGRIDHVLMHVPLGISLDWLERLETLLRPAARKYGMLPHFTVRRAWLGSADAGFVPSPLLGCARNWVAVTPYRANTHPSETRERPIKAAVERELNRELDKRKYHARKTEALDFLVIAGSRVEAEKFKIQRSDPAKKDARGGNVAFFFRVEFTEPVAGPLACGYSCHLGLGLFRREDSLPGRPLIEPATPGLRKVAVEREEPK